MGKTRHLFKKIRDTKGIFHAKMGSIKDRNGMDLTEAEDIKKRWQEYTEELLGNPIDRGAWQVTANGLQKSWTRLSDLACRHACWGVLFWRGSLFVSLVYVSILFFPGESQGRRSLVGCHLWGRTELDMTEAT